MAPISIPKAPTLKGPVLSAFTLEPPKKGGEKEWSVRRMELCALLLNSFKEPTMSYELSASKMLSIVCSCIPELEKYLSANTPSVTFKPLSYQDLVEKIASGEAPGSEDSDDWAFTNVDPACLTITNPMAVCASSAVAWLSYAKSAGESSRTAMEQARPKAMKGKYKLKDDEVLLFPGESLGPEIENLDQVNLGFSLYPEVKKMMTSFFLSIKASSSFVPPNVDPFMMLFDMLENVGMTHVGIVTRFVEMHPWGLRIPELAADLSIFATELTKMAMIDPATRPYHRLLVPPTDYIFVGSKFRALTAVAGSFVVEVDGSFKDYVYNYQNYTDLISRVRQRAPTNAEIPDVAALEALFGVIATKPGVEGKTKIMTGATVV